MKMNNEISKYLNGEMDAESEKMFEQKLHNDKNLRNEFELQKEIQNAIGEEDIMELREKLEEYEPSARPGKKFRLKWPDVLAAAGFVTLLIGIGMLWIYYSQITNTDELYARYFEPYPSIYSQRSVDEDSKHGILKKEAFLAYEKENWDKAKNHFDELFLLQPENAEIAFYTGILELKLNNTHKAIKRFRILLEKDDPLLEDQTIWYIALAHLKEGNVDKSVEYLKKIVKDDMANKEKASKLLRRIE
ncbi:MAG: tetratricopeptide repeat protein [Bacteroidota bacterium]